MRIHKLESGGSKAFELSPHLDPQEVRRVHDGALEELDGGEVPLEEALQLQVRGLPAIRGQPHTSKG